MSATVEVLGDTLHIQKLRHLLAVERVHFLRGQPVRHVHAQEFDAIVRRSEGEELVDALARFGTAELRVLQECPRDKPAHRVSHEMALEIGFLHRLPVFWRMRADKGPDLEDQVIKSSCICLDVPCLAVTEESGTVIVVSVDDERPGWNAHGRVADVQLPLSSGH
jgi:hypothetical protein